jgi:phosphoribosylamine--glycine ligase
VIICCAPGNPGTAELATNLAIAADDIDRIADATDMYGIDLVIIGPEVPLALGLADRLRAEGRLVAGPGAAAARIEASKAFSKEVMAAAGIPTAASETFTDLPAALAYVAKHAEPLVVKASGLAAGKGAIVCATRAEATAAVQSMLGEHQFGDAGSVVVIEAFLVGEEVSLLGITDGHTVELLPAAQDHKRLLEDDKGPNTGGMGAYAPVSLATPALLERARNEVFTPCPRNSPAAGLPSAACLRRAHGGSRRHAQRRRANCRLGDPETELSCRWCGGLLAAFDATPTARRLPGSRSPRRASRSPRYSRPGAIPTSR